MYSFTTNFEKERLRTSNLQFWQFRGLIIALNKIDEFVYSKGREINPL